MNVTWLSPGRALAPGLEEGRAEIEWEPRAIPMSALFADPPPATPADADERAWLERELPVVVEEIVADRDTRRAVVVNEFPSGLRVNCFCLFHFTVRDGCLDLYVYSRSADVRRLGYDLTTVDLVYRRALALLDAARVLVAPGSVTVHLHSLHYYSNGREG